MNFCVFTPDLVLRCNEFIKVRCHKDIKRIFIKSYQYLANFSSEIEKLNEEKTFKIQNDEVCSFCIGNCLHVYLYSGLKRKIYLLHNSKEDKKLHLPKGRIVELDDICNYIVGHSSNSIVLYTN